jgi:hypothetical protein
VHDTTAQKFAGHPFLAAQLQFDFAARPNAYRRTKAESTRCPTQLPTPQSQPGYAANAANNGADIERQYHHQTTGDHQATRRQDYDT